MKLKDYLGIIIFLIIFASNFIKTSEQNSVDSEITAQVNQSLLNNNTADNQNTIQDGFVKVIDQPGRFTQQKLQTVTNNKSGKDYTYTWKWGSKDETATTASALGLDDLHHFANSYLIGYMPFYTEKNWVPLYVLASRKIYQLDHLQYSGITDIWQNSAQAFKQTRGDCEDHAIALADWLINLGMDAQVVLGKYKNEGHAWVIVFKEGKEYLLEATGKRKSKRWSQYSLAGTQTDYHPKYRFNRDNFWINTGSEYTVKYSGSNWKKTSTFYKEQLSI